MNPMMPKITPELERLAVALVMQAGELRGLLHTHARQAIGDIVRQMNSYYSNLIEGHRTLPHDIERALAGDFSDDPAKRVLQIEACAHIEVQQLITKRLRKESVNVLSEEFIRWVHKEFYDRLPEELLIITDRSGKTHRVVPGEFREGEVYVGKHVAPAANALPHLLNYFSKQYNVEKLQAIEKIVALAASHHRLLWIHPFLDGNGRVARLVTDAYLDRLGLSADGLWTPVRGLARFNDKYKKALTMADAPRQGDLDGRGNLSEKGLEEFCKFFLTICYDQVKFMSNRLGIGSLDKKIESYVRLRAAEGTLRPEASYILQDVIRRGSIARGDVERISGLKERTARTLLGQLLKEGLLVAESPKGNVRIGFPVRVREHFFPKLYHIPLPGEEDEDEDLSVDFPVGPSR